MGSRNFIIPQFRLKGLNKNIDQQRSFMPRAYPESMEMIAQNVEVRNFEE